MPHNRDLELAQPKKDVALGTDLPPATRLPATLAAPLLCAWHHRHLARRLIRREIEARFRGTVLGKVWAGIAPLMMLGLYTFVFGVLIQPQWQAEVSDKFTVPLIYFSGLILFQFFLDVFSRAPGIIRDHAVYVKKVVFPVEIFAWTLVGAALVRLAIGFGMLLLFHLLLKGLPPPALLLVPLFVLPLALMSAGIVWFLAGIGTYVRDVTQIVMVLTPVMMFVSPVFFPLSAVPEPARSLLYANPLSFPIEAVRAVLFRAEFGNWAGLAAYTLAALLMAGLGYRFFMRVRPGFADVL